MPHVVVNIAEPPGTRSKPFDAVAAFYGRTPGIAPALSVLKRAL